MPGNGANPLPSIRPKTPAKADRQNAFERKAVTDITVGPGLTMHRVGNAVSIGRVSQKTSGGETYVRLVHTGDDLYTAYGIDDIDHEGAELATGLEPLGGRPFGTTVDIITHAEFGKVAFVGENKAVTLMEAFGEEYDTKICAEEEPPP